MPREPITRPSQHARHHGVQSMHEANRQSVCPVRTSIDEANDACFIVRTDRSAAFSPLKIARDREGRDVVLDPGRVLHVDWAHVHADRRCDRFGSRNRA